MRHITIPSDNNSLYIWSGKAIRINRRYGARIVGRKAMLFNTPQYTQFVESMAMTFMTQHKGPPIEGDVAIFISFSLARKKGKSGADTDAYNKQIMDALEHGGVIANDNQVKFQATINAGADPDGITDTISVVVMELEGDIEFF
jgi:Holliday junction resolvase RusA-like endonuclease